MSTPELLRELPASISHEPMLMTEAGIGGRAIDRCSPHLRDPLRAKSLNPVLSRRQPSKPATNFDKHSSKGKNKKKAQSETKHVELLSPASSQRYLLGSEANSEEFFEPAAPFRSVTVNEEQLRFQSSKIVEEAFFTRPSEPLSRFQTVKVEEPSDARPSSSSSSSSSSSNSKKQQVVVLRVSLHCKGCEGKVRKHISKMEGVTSFTTDLVNKKVTVTGDVTPLGVLNSISKVKNAQIWPSQPRALA